MAVFYERNYLSILEGLNKEWTLGDIPGDGAKEIWLPAKQTRREEGKQNLKIE